MWLPSGTNCHQDMTQDNARNYPLTIHIKQDVGLHFGVPQASILGQQNYCMYNKLVGEIIKRHNIKYHCHADDNQVYMTKPWDKRDDISSSIESCIADIITWMNSNMLKFNKDKAAFIVFSSKQYVKKPENLCIKVGSSYINCSMSVRNLGFILNNALGMEKKANSILSPIK